MELEKLKKSTKIYKVLYVEDSMMMRKVTHKILSSYFDHIDVAKNGLEALELYKEFHENSDGGFYDIVITDLEMPVMDGEVLSKKIFEFNHTQELIVISSIEDFRKLVNLINIGVTKFISKPIEEEQLNDVIYQVYENLRIKQMQEEEALEVLEYNKILKEKEDEQEKIIAIKAKELEEFNYALDSSAIVVKTDVNGVLTYVNELCCDISAYTKEELIGQNSSILSSGNRPKSFFKKLWNTISSKKKYKTVFENRTKDGSIYYVETTINPILNIDGEIVEYIGVSHDMTQLMKSLDEAKKAKKAKEDFFINISHEMKTPLNSILGFSALLKKRLADDSKSLLMVDTIHDTGNDLNKLVESILDMKKIQEHSLELIEVAFNPKEEIAKVINKYIKDSFEKNQKFETYMDPDIPGSILGDPNRIAQVIGIVIDNAIKFTDNDGNIRVSVEYDDSKKELIVDVKDSGIGISKEDQEKIFNMQQVDANSNRAYEGAGLGLSIAYNLIRAMKGNISLKSIPSKGSVFRLEFPVK